MAAVHVSIPSSLDNGNHGIPWPVFIPADSFMEKDQDKQSCWITLAPGMVIQALLAERDGEQRVYVITEETPPKCHWIHDRWPRLREVICSVQI